MDLATAQDTFAVRLYEWSRRDFLRELQEGCPLMSTLGLNNRHVAAFVAWNETLSSSERRALALALTRRFHENAVRLKAEVLSEADKAWGRVVYEQTFLFMEKLPPLPTAERVDPDFKPVNPGRCLDTLTECLSPEMGRRRRLRSGVVCTRKLGEWKIVTEFTFLRRNTELSFVYQFIRKDGDRVTEPHPAQGPFPRTMLLFYGISNSSVTVPSEKDSDPMANAIAKLAEYFVVRAEPLFAGLGAND
jgi:hypothetical protein